MKDKLTNEEIAKVFAMYYPHDVQCYNTDNENKPFPRLDRMIHVLEWLDKKDTDIVAKLILRPLSSISDEDCADIAYELGSKIDSDSVKTFLEINDYESMPAIIFQALVKYGYAVKLWFGIDHWANGKTAIELGIAIDHPRIS